MGRHAKVLADAAVLGPRYAQRLCKDIPANIFGSLATPGGVTIDSNHPAFVIGHLNLYPVRVLDFLKLPTDQVTPPELYQKLFSKDAKCVDDRTCELYPHKDELMTFFERSYHIALESLRQADDELLLADNPVDSPMKQLLPTLGSVIGFYLGGHVMSHCGQISAWRRMQLLPPA
jgi:hypothetical protein